MKINFDDDYWMIKPNNITLEEFHKFDFTCFKSNSLKNQVKTFFMTQLYMNSLGRTTLARYCYGWEVFNQFLVESRLSINYLDELTLRIIEGFAEYLTQRFKSSGSRVYIYAGVKSVVVYGQILELERYPQNPIFPGNESRLFHHDDELKSKDIDRFVLLEIDKAIINETNLYTKTMIAIARQTGMRLSEILSLQEGCIIKDFLDMPLLCGFSYKNDEERIIPISLELALIIYQLEKQTEKIRKIYNTSYIFSNGFGKLINQSKAKALLAQFISGHNIVDQEGERVKINFHQFRHTLGTQALNLGISPLDIKAMLGHKSVHSTNLYAKLWSRTLASDYKKVGFIGLTTKSLGEFSNKTSFGNNMFGSLPDGYCKNIFDGKDTCQSFNRCLLCAKFITTPEFLEVHMKHLQRIQKDKMRYMHEEYICNLQKVERIESALSEIIKRLEVIE